MGTTTQLTGRSNGRGEYKAREVRFQVLARQSVQTPDWRLDVTPCGPVQSTDASKKPAASLSGSTFEAPDFYGKSALSTSLHCVTYQYYLQF